MSNAHDYLDPATGQWEKEYAIAPRYTPKWLVNKRGDVALPSQYDVMNADVRLVEIQLPSLEGSQQYPSHFNVTDEEQRWRARLLSNETYKGYRARGDSWRTREWTSILQSILIHHEGSPVGWYDLDGRVDGGLVRYATLWDLAHLKQGVPQDEILSGMLAGGGDEAERAGLEQAFGQKLWLLSQKQWDEAEFPRPIDDGPPFASGATVEEQTRGHGAREAHDIKKPSKKEKHDTAKKVYAWIDELKKRPGWAQTAKPQRGGGDFYEFKSGDFSTDGTMRITLRTNGNVGISRVSVDWAHHPNARHIDNIESVDELIAMAEGLESTFPVPTKLPAPDLTPAWLLVDGNKVEVDAPPMNPFDVERGSPAEMIHQAIAGDHWNNWHYFLDELARSGFERTMALYLPSQLMADTNIFRFTRYDDDPGYERRDPVRYGDALNQIQIRHKGSPVWWVDLDEGPERAATLYDLAMHTQPWGGSWLMSLDQWDNAEYPPESQGGPPYVKGVSVAREAREDSTEYHSRFFVAPAATPRWLSTGHPRATPVVEVDATPFLSPEPFPEDYPMSDFSKSEYLESFEMDAVVASKVYHRAAERWGTGTDFLEGPMLRGVSVRHNGSPVWWVDLDKGPVQEATMLDLVRLTRYPQPWRVMKTGTYEGQVVPPRTWAGKGKPIRAWLMSLDQWDRAEYPPESEGGPPYVKGVSVARERRKR